MSEQIFEENISMEELLDSVNVDFDTSTGEIIKGEVISTDENYAYLNIGKKTEGRVLISEFDIKPNKSDVFDVVLKSNKLQDGMFSLSYEAAAKIQKWEQFKSNFNENNQIIEGSITELKNNGCIVEFDMYSAFLPQSQYGDLRPKNMKKTDIKKKFKIIKIDAKKRSVIVSRKVLVDEQKEISWQKISDSSNVGDVIEGEVVKVVEFGAFVDIGGFEALVHNNDLTWKKYFSKKDILKEGDKKSFKILGINREEKKVSLGLKQMSEDPWTVVESKYKVGDTVSGRLTTITKFGIFVEIDDLIEGLVPGSEISWTKQNVNLKDLYKKDDEITAEIINIDVSEKKLGLSIKALTDNPWDGITNNFSVGSIHKSKIKKVATFGIFVQLENNIDGMIHVSDLSWDDKADLKKYKEGDDIEFKVLEIDKKKQKISCGVKQLTRSPWELIKEKYPLRSKIKGEVSKIAPFGMFIKVEDNIEAMVHVSEVSRKKIENIEEKYSVGDVVEAVIQNIDVAKKRMAASIKMLEIVQEKEELDKLLKNGVSKTVSIGDMIKLKNEGK